MNLGQKNLVKDGLRQGGTQKPTTFMRMPGRLSTCRATPMGAMLPRGHQCLIRAWMSKEGRGCLRRGEDA